MGNGSGWGSPPYIGAPVEYYADLPSVGKVDDIRLITDGMNPLSLTGPFLATYDGTGWQPLAGTVDYTLMPSVATYAALPIVGNTMFDARLVLDESWYYLCTDPTGATIADQWIKWREAVTMIGTDAVINESSAPGTNATGAFNYLYARANNDSIYWTNNAGTGIVEAMKVNTSDEVEFPVVTNFITDANLDVGIPATAGTIEVYSPDMYWKSYAWDTDDSVSRTNEFKLNLEAFSSISADYSAMYMKNRVDGGAWQETFALDSLGVLRVNGLTTSNILSRDFDDTLNLTSRELDSATAVGHVLDIDSALTTAGAKLVSFRNNAAEKLYIDKDGYLGTPSGEVTIAGDLSTTGDFLINFPLDLGTDPGSQTVIDKILTAASVAGTAEHIYFDIDNEDYISMQAENNGTGGIKKGHVKLHKHLVKAYASISNTDGVSAVAPYVVPDEVETVYVDTSTAAVWIQLSTERAGVTNSHIKVVDYKGNAATNNITVQSEGSETFGGNATFIVNTDYSTVDLNADPDGNFAIIGVKA